MYRNNEYYLDPTWGDAVKSIIASEKIKKKKENGDWYMRWVYIASPYKGDVEANVLRAKRYARFVASKGHVPMCPHIYFTQFLDDSIPCEREAGIYLGIQMLKRCRELWVFGEKISEGMQSEIDFAVKNMIPIKYFTTECKEVEHL